MVDLLFDKFSTISKFFIFWTVQEGPGRLLGGVSGSPDSVRGGPGDVLGWSWAVLGRS